MKLRKKDGIFLFLSVLILVAAVIFVCVGARASGPEITYHEFQIPITYEQYGEVKTKTVTYCVHYGEEAQAFDAYYEDSGMLDIVSLAEMDTEEEWWVEFSMEGGYLMGDPAYADFYADGMPEPALGYCDEDWNEYHGVMEVERYGVKLIGCEYPEPIENRVIDQGIKLDHTAIGVLTGLAFVILLLGILLVKKENDVVYQSCDKTARILNLAVAVIALPLMFALGAGWDLLPTTQSIDTLLAALMAPITVLGICASVILRRKGKSAQGMVAQFTGLLVFLYLIVTNVLVIFGWYQLFLAAGAAIGVLIVVRTKRDKAVAPTRLDTISLVTNVALIPVYSILSVLMLFIAAITDVSYEVGAGYELLAILCPCVIAAGSVYCGLALGMSVALRRKGKSLAGFLVQFAGFGCIPLVMLMELLPWVSISIN